MNQVKREEITLMVLAAGESRRMGSPKQLLPIGDMPMIEWQLRKWMNVDIANRIVVLGAYSEKIGVKVVGFEKVINDDWHLGMGSSIKKGLQYISDNQPATEAILIVLLDQVEISSDHLNQLLLKYFNHPDKIIAAQSVEIIGPPAIFPKIFFPLLASIGDRYGARKLIEAAAKDVLPFELTESAIDLDTQEDYRRFLKRHP